MLMIDNDTVAQVLDMPSCIEAQEAAFRQIPDGGAAFRGRIDMYAPCERPDGYYRWGTMEGYNDGILAIRMKSDVMTWPRDENGRWTEDKYCVEPGTYCGLIFLLSALVTLRLPGDRSLPRIFPLVTIPRMRYRLAHGGSRRGFRHRPDAGRGRRHAVVASHRGAGAGAARLGVSA